MRRATIRTAALAAAASLMGMAGLAAPPDAAKATAAIESKSGSKVTGKAVFTELPSGGVKVEEANNPIGPAPLCQAFRQAMREFEVNVKVKLIIYKLFDRYVMAGLEPLYDEVNAELIRAGVLPQIRHQLPVGTLHE